MKCPKCSFENPERMKFCGECGSKLEKRCPACDAANPANFKFCGECGHRLASTSQPASKELSADEKLQKIQRYLPKGIAEKILSQREKIEGEHKRVTVMFCDMVGFTKLSEHIGPEEAYSVMDKVYEILIHKVHDYEGTVNEMTGDGLMALFGAPIALEDAPQRAVRSALSIHRELINFNAKIKQEKGFLPPIKMRAGIHTGPVVVGTLGNDLRVEFKAVGDTVNLASRMESLAEPGTTYITEDTFKSTEGLFRVEALGKKEIKGKEKPVRVYQVIAPSTRRTRFDVSAERGLTPFVGRQRSLELLMDAYERAKEGHGQAVSIIAEAGIGKSRLLYEFRKAVTHENNTFLEGKCLSYSRNLAYHPIVDILKANFDIQDSDVEQIIRKKVSQGLKSIGVDEADTLPYLLALLSVKDSGIDNIPMSPETRRDRTLQALKKIVLKGSEVRPLVMAVEDLHWMDKSSENVLKQLLESISGSAVMLIFTCRPEFVSAWSNRSYHSQITLNRLSNRESLAMASYLLHTTHIEKDIEELILSKTEGIPFFIEEFIKSLKEREIIQKDNGDYKLTRDFNAISTPSTIQDVIMARVDYLSEGAREVLRIGSAIEREFSHEMIQKVTGESEEQLLSHLSRLRDAELIYERGIYPDVTYIFKHALTREVVYEAILSANRKQLHKKIAAAMETIYGENICDCYGLLARHCMESEDFDKAAEYARLEARKYFKTASLRESVEYAKKAIACLEKLPRSETVQKRRIDARVMLATYYQILGYLIEGKEAVEPVTDLSLELDYQKGLAGIYSALGLYYAAVEEDFDKGMRYLKNVSEIAEKTGDYITLWMANNIMGGNVCHNYQFEESLACLQTSFDLSTLANNLAGMTQAKSGLAMTYNLWGKQELAFQMSSEALENARESGDVLALQLAYTSHGMSCYYKGYLPEAEQYLVEAMAYHEKAANGAYGQVAASSLGYTYGEMHKYDKALEFAEKFISMIEDTRTMLSWANVHKLFMAKVHILNKDKEVDLHEVESLIASHEKSRLAACEAAGALLIAEIYMHIDDHHLIEAESWINRAIGFNTKYDTKWELARDHVVYAEWFFKGGDVAKTRQQLTTAIGLFGKCGADGWVEKYEKELATL
ncbi:MAG: AAA family ATPase [Desulfobacteraceae bacterium]|nr:AAA family ATPase [Desulfobacteraceae bacterium]